MDAEKDHAPSGHSDEKAEFKLSAEARDETLHDSALRGHLATDK
jgi:hypothetical protein